MNLKIIGKSCDDSGSRRASLIRIIRKRLLVSRSVQRLLARQRLLIRNGIQTSVSLTFTNENRTRRFHRVCLRYCSETKEWKQLSNETNVIFEVALHGGRGHSVSDVQELHKSIIEQLRASQRNGWKTKHAGTVLGDKKSQKLRNKWILNQCVISRE